MQDNVNYIQFRPLHKQHLTNIMIISLLFGDFNSMKIIAQFFGLLAMFSLFLIYQQKNRKNIILAKLSADFFWVAHYLCLGGIGGMIPNAIGIFRELVFINRKNKAWANKLIWPILFIVINFSLGTTMFYSFFNVLPITASAFVTISLWIDNPKLTKLITIPVCIAFMVYDFYIKSYVGIFNEAISIGSIILNFIKERRKANEQ